MSNRVGVQADGNVQSFARAIEQVDALLSPRNVVIVGASERPGAWGRRVWNSLKRHNFPKPIYPLNPTRPDVWGVTCYPDFDALPEPPDHLAIMVPAAQVADVISRASAAGARSATIFSAGFGEGESGEGAALRDELCAVVRKTGIALSGPNCFGNLSAAGPFVTLIEDRKQSLKRGSIALVGQSGGTLMALNQCLEGRGMDVDYVVTSGNELGLTTADYIAYFATQPHIRVIAVYLEHIADAHRLRAATQMAADAGKIVVAYKLGQSEAGRTAALAHTGALAGTVQAFDAVFSACGVVRVDTLDDLIEVTELATRSGIPCGARVGAITLSGAFRAILLDTADRAGVQFPKLTAETEEKLKGFLSTGSYAGNPIDGGFSLVSDPNILTKCLEALNGDPNIDFIFIQGPLPREPANARLDKYVELADAFAGGDNHKPVSFLSFASYGLTDYAREVRARASKVSFLQEVHKGLRAVSRASATRSAQQLRAATKKRSNKAEGEGRLKLARLSNLASKASGRIVNETDAKAFLASYGVQTPAEQVVQTLEQALQAAEEIGYPVVLKFVSSKVLHKSDIGGVQLGIQTPEELRRGFETLRENLQRHDVHEDGFLVASFVEGGTEIALGIHNDPEVGPLVMVGAGGVLLELIKDVEFRAPPIDHPMALDMVRRLKSYQLLTGFRGKSAQDVDALCSAIVKMSDIAEDCGDALESIDVNPLAVMSKGCLALDAAIVLKEEQPSTKVPPMTANT